MNALDATLQSVCPTVMLPRFAAFEPLAQDGHRFLAASDGLHVEVRRSWLSCVLPIAESTIPLPYGAVEAGVTFQFGRELAAFVAQFAEEARVALPNEHAAWLSFDSNTDSLAYEAVGVIERRGDHIRYTRPTGLPRSRTLAVDLHSHGRFPAFFSSEDDQDGVDDAKPSTLTETNPLLLSKTDPASAHGFVRSARNS